MNVGPLDTITIQVRDWDRAVSWYTTVLGLDVAVSEPDDRFCMLTTGGCCYGPEAASGGPDIAETDR